MNEQKPVFNIKKNLLVISFSFGICLILLFIVMKYSTTDNAPAHGYLALIFLPLLFFGLINLFEKIFK